MKRNVTAAAVLAMAVGQWASGDIYPWRRRGISLPEREPSEEEQARRIQAAAERRQRRNAKHKEKNDGNA